jgi:hypothetical protein
MKRFSFFLVLSLLVNAVLAVWVLRSKKAAATRVLQLAEAVASVQNASGVSKSVPTPRTDVNLWTALSTEDIHEYMRRLQAAGFSAGAVRALVMMKISELFEKRREGLVTNSRDLPYWRARSFSAMDPKQSAESNKLAEEQLSLMSELFGKGNWVDDERFQKSQNARFGNLSSEKIRGILALEQTFSEQVMKLHLSNVKPGATPSPELQEKLNALWEQQRAETEALLTPAERQEYEIHSGVAANLLRQDFKTFRPTEAEFKALFPFYQATFEEIRKAAPLDNDENASQPSPLRETLKPQIQAILGPERYADFVQANEPGATRLNQLTERLGLPIAAAAQVTAVQKDVSQRADSVRKDPALTSEQRAAQLADLSEEAEVKITATLGDRGFDAYKQYAGDWLNKIQGKGSAKK